MGRMWWWDLAAVWRQWLAIVSEAGPGVNLCLMFIPSLLYHAPSSCSPFLILTGSQYTLLACLPRGSLPVCLSPFWTWDLYCIIFIPARHWDYLWTDFFFTMVKSWSFCFHLCPYSLSPLNSREILFKRKVSSYYTCDQNLPVIHTFLTELPSLSPEAFAHRPLFTLVSLWFLTLCEAQFHSSGSWHLLGILFLQISIHKTWSLASFRNLLKCPLIRKTFFTIQYK